MLIDSARVCIGLGPLAIYLLVIGVVNLLPRPFVTSGLRDLAALGVGVGGLVLIGPVELFTSMRLVFSLGPIYWLMVLGIYVSALATILLYLPPRIVIYNVSPSALRPALEEAAAKVDPAAQWSGDCLLLPACEMQLRMEGFSLMRNVSLVPVGDSYNLSAWRLLQSRLREQLAGLKVAPNPRGLTMVLIGVMMFVVMATHWLRDPQEVTRGLFEMFGLG